MGNPEPWTPGPWTWIGDSPDGVEPHFCPHSTEWTDHGPDLEAGEGAWKPCESYCDFKEGSSTDRGVPREPGHEHLHRSSTVISSSGYDASSLGINQADARLIALAPEMAELLQAVLDETDEGNLEGPFTLYDRDIRALLARARGKE